MPRASNSRRCERSIQAALNRNRLSTLKTSTIWLVLGFALAGCEDPVDRSIALGDRLLAVGDTDEAIAEYKLAQRVGGATAEVLLRLGHAYASRGDVDEAIAYYEMLIERNPELRHQVAADLAAMAVAARERGATENMSRSLRPLLDWGLGYVPTDLQQSLAVRYASEGDYSRSLSLYLALLADERASSPAVLYQVGLAYEQLGGCDRALSFFQQYLAGIGRRDPDRDAARFHYGNCLFVSADEDRAAGRPAAALGKLDRMVELGVPRTLMVDAQFLRGEMLLSGGNTDAALEAYQRVLELNPTRTHALVRRAEERIRQIRFGFE